MKPSEVGTVSKVRSEMIVQFIWEAQNNLKEEKRKKTSGVNFIVELHKQHNELYLLPARAAVLLRHLSEYIQLIECNKPGQKTSKCVTDVRNYLFVYRKLLTWFLTRVADENNLW